MKLKNIKILHVVGAMNKGGTETMLMNLYRRINRERIQFDFLSFSEEEAYYDKEINELGGRVIRSSKSSNSIAKIIDEYGPYDVVHAHTLFNSGSAMIAAKKSGIKNRISHAHTTLDDSSSFIRRVYIKLMRYLINKNSTYLLACSNEAGKYLFGENVINKNNYTYFPNLIDYQSVLDFSQGEVNQFKSENDLEHSLVIGHIGTFKPAKNQKFLVSILKEMKTRYENVKLVLVGDGSQRAEITELVKQYNLEKDVIFTGTRDDIDTLLHSMDIFVFPSIYEGLGLVLLEAQAAGLPCLVSEAIQPEADLKMGLVEKLNLSDGVEAWSNKIIEMCDSKKIDKKTIRNVFDSSDYSTEKCINKLMDIYDINY